MLTMALECTFPAGPRRVSQAGEYLDKLRPFLLSLRRRTTMITSERRLVSRIIAGDVGSWQTFITRYAPFIYKAIVRYTDDTDEKMEIFVRVLEKLRQNDYERLSRFDFRSALSTWLTVVARHIGLDFLRSRYGRNFELKTVRLVSCDDQPEALNKVATTRDPRREFEDRQRAHTGRTLRQQLAAVFPTLTPQEVLLIKLVYFQGLKVSEAGRLLGINPAYKFLDRTLVRIKRELLEHSGLSAAEIDDFFFAEVP